MGRIAWYGAATWSGFRQALGAATALSLRALDGIARQVAGAAHRFRFIQLPVNLAMPEAFTRREPESVLDAAAELNITVIASAPLLQARLARSLPDEIAATIPHFETHAQRALQFARSTPGITAALTGMSKVEHVAENLMLQAVRPMTPDEYLSIYR